MNKMKPRLHVAVSPKPWKQGIHQGRVWHLSARKLVNHPCLRACRNPGKHSEVHVHTCMHVWMWWSMLIHSEVLNAFLVYALKQYSRSHDGQKSDRKDFLGGRGEKGFGNYEKWNLSRDAKEESWWCAGLNVCISSFRLLYFFSKCWERLHGIGVLSSGDPSLLELTFAR